MLARRILSVIILFLLSACISAPAAVDQPKAPQASVVIDPTPVIQSETTAPVLLSSAPPEDSELDSVITASNLTRLVPHLLKLPEYPERVLWPKPGTPAVPSEVSILIQSGPSLYPIELNLDAVNPASLGRPIPLPLNGNSIVAFAPDDSSLLVQEPGRLALYSVDGRLIREIDELDRTSYAVYSPDSTTLAITSQEEFATYVYGLDGSIVKLEGFETAAPVYGVILGPQGKTLAWISRGTLQLHDVTAVQDGLGTRLDFTGFIGPVTFSPDGSRLALDVEGNLHLYRVVDGSLIAQLALDSPLSTLAFSPDGSILAANFRDGFQTWNGETLEPLVTLPGAGTGTLWTGFSPDGRLLLTLHNENELRLWRVE
jgi:hypothetical protein